MCCKVCIDDLTEWPGVGFIRIPCEEDPGNNRKDCFQCIGCSTNQKPLVVRGESWRNHKQTKAHSLRAHPAELPHESHGAGVIGVAPLVLATIPQPQPSAVIPVDDEISWADDVWMGNDSNLDEPYYAEDGSAIQFSAGMMYPSSGETIRYEMDQLTEELEIWGSSLAGEDFGGGVDGMGGQCEGRMNNISCFLKLMRV